MGIYRAYQCPDCSGIFRFLHHPNDEPPPNYCPLCGAYVGDDADPTFVPAAPHIARSIGKSADQVYRAAEAASVANAEAAAELTGGDPADFSAMKITDMADYLRPGDVAAKMPATPVTKVMNGNGQGGFQPLMGKTGADYAAATGNGAFPHAGEVARQSVVSGHTQRARMVEARGNIGRHQRGK
jgi:hypothetical protein